MPITAPPVVPPEIPNPQAEYLRRLSLWAQQELQKAILKDEATPSLILAAYDTKMNPRIFRIQVTNSGALQANNVPLGGGKP